MSFQELGCQLAYMFVYIGIAAKMDATVWNNRTYSSTLSPVRHCSREGKYMRSATGAIAKSVKKATVACDALPFD